MNNDIIVSSIFDNYGIVIKKIELIRKMVGAVYLVENNQSKYVLKIYKKHTTIPAEKIANIMDYIYNQNGPVPKTYHTKASKLVCRVNGQQAVLQEFIQGEDVERSKHKDLILTTFDKIQDIMKSYPEEVPQKSKEFYINRYLKLLELIKYDKLKIEKLEEISNYHFDNVKNLPTSFFHGDFHTGNMILKENKIFVFDFDACCRSSSLLDLVTCFDYTNFNAFTPVRFIKTRNILKSLNKIAESNLNYALSFIPIRHLEIISTILDAKDEQLTLYLANQQYDWIIAYDKVLRSIEKDMVKN